jgi:hypothetical protein
LSSYYNRVPQQDFFNYAFIAIGSDFASNASLTRSLAFLMVMRSSDFLSSSTVFVFVHPSETAVSNVVFTKSDDDAATLTGVSTGAFFASNASFVNSLAFMMVMRSSDFLSSSKMFVFVHPSETAVSNVFYKIR